MKKAADDRRCTAGVVVSEVLTRLLSIGTIAIFDRLFSRLFLTPPLKPCGYCTCFDNDETRAILTQPLHHRMPVLRNVSRDLQVAVEVKGVAMERVAAEEAALSSQIMIYHQIFSITIVSTTTQPLPPTVPLVPPPPPPPLEEEDDELPLPAAPGVPAVPGNPFFPDSNHSYRARLTRRALIKWQEISKMKHITN
ncbi:hypothetical protein DAPPUDRAFT_97108 [Daphnia pulex]|uniref:Uncharacterized protein n=1 Tax=Daphnia pulex TaxID=6669 RepID=E9G0M9_DAPPU|nr:hypothetical protein DAPPUDRAFT_97108 [Daphnia pulex]|eukprot:EFX86934.1 hypothetical protein DAPPUDRAFT_97108 [Daphnia pulex]